MDEEYYNDVLTNLSQQILRLLNRSWLTFEQVYSFFDHEFRRFLTYENCHTLHSDFTAQQWASTGIAIEIKNRFIDRFTRMSGDEQQAMKLLIGTSLSNIVPVTFELICRKKTRKIF